MLLKCEHCGAPLDVKPHDVLTKCAYCGWSMRVPQAPARPHPTPHNWHPPAFWTPPPQYHLPPRPMVYHAPPKAAGCAVIAVLLPIMLVGIFLAGLVFFIRGAAQHGPNVGSARWDAKTTFRCGAGEPQTITGVKMTQSIDTAIEASAGCNLEIRDSVIRANTAIRADINGRVAIHDSTIYATDEVVRALHASKVELHNVTIHLAAKRPSMAGVVAFTAEGMGEVTVDDSTMMVPTTPASGAAYVAVVKEAGKVRIAGGKFGGDLKVKVDMPAELRVTRTTLKAAVEGDGTVTGVERPGAAPAETSKPRAAPPRPSPRPKAPPR